MAGGSTTRNVRRAANTVADTLQGQNRANQQSAIRFFREAVMQDPTPAGMELVELAHDLAATTPSSNAHR